jgi:hypothetical protein
MITLQFRGGQATPLNTGLGIERCAQNNEGGENYDRWFRFSHDAVPS